MSLGYSMFCFILRRNVLQQIITTDLTTPSLTHLYSSLLLQNPSSLSNTTITTTQNPSSFTVSYLINSCGLSPESALSASQKIQLKSPERPDSVLKLFQNHGFTNTHIAEIIAKRPLLLLASVNKTLKPKLDFFHSVGITGPTLLKILSADPGLLHRSLNNQIVPAVDFLKSFVHTDENIATSFKRNTRVFQMNLEKAMGPNISILRDEGVVESKISKLITSHPRTMMLKPDRFREIVTLAKEMGFDQSGSNFILVICVMSRMTKLNWERKVEGFRSLGWSEDEFLSAFKLQPMCMITSQEKIRRVVDLVGTQMDLKPSSLSKYPDVFLLSLEKRIAPRCSILRVLIQNSLIKKDLSITWALKMSEEDFLERFVIKYEENIPEIQTIYQGKMGF